MNNENETKMNEMIAQASSTSTTSTWAPRTRPCSRATGRSPHPRTPSGTLFSPCAVRAVCAVCAVCGADEMSGSGAVEYYVGCGMRCKLDGEGIKKHGRPPVQLSIVLDISGSMGSPFRHGAPQNSSCRRACRVMSCVGCIVCVVCVVDS